MTAFQEDDYNSLHSRKHKWSVSLYVCMSYPHKHTCLCSHSCFFFQTCPLSVFLSSALDKSDALLASTFLLQVMIHHSRPFRSHSSLIIHLIRLLISNMSQKHSYVLPQTDHKHTHCAWDMTRSHPQCITALIIFNCNMAFNCKTETVASMTDLINWLRRSPPNCRSRKTNRWRHSSACLDRKTHVSARHYPTVMSCPLNAPDGYVEREQEDHMYEINTHIRKCILYA